MTTETDIKALQARCDRPMQEPANDIQIPPPIEINTVEEWLFSDRCRHIAGDGAGRTFCGHARKPGKAWCERHYDLCVRKKLKCKN